MKILDVDPERKAKFDELRRRELERTAERRRAYSAEYRRQNREKINAYRREYEKKNREKRAAYLQRYRLENPDRYLEARIRAAISFLGKHGYSVIKLDTEGKTE